MPRCASRPSDSAPRRNERPRPTARRSPAPRRATRRRRPPTRRRRGRRHSAARGPSRPRPLAPPKPAIRPSAPRPGPTSSRRWCRQPARQQGPLRRVQLTPVHVHRHHPRRHVRPALQLANLRRDTGGRTRSDPVTERPGSARFRTTRPHGSVLPSGSGDRPSPGRPCQGSSFVERPGSLGRDHNQRAVSRARLRRPRDVLRGRKRPPVTGDPPTTSTGRASPDDPWPAGSPANTSGSSFVERLGLPGRDHDQRAVSRARLSTTLRRLAGSEATGHHRRPAGHVDGSSSAGRPGPPGSGPTKGAMEAIRTAEQREGLVRPLVALVAEPVSPPGGSRAGSTSSTRLTRP